METLNHSGTVTAGAERVCPVEESHMGMVNVLREFHILLDMMLNEHPEEFHVNTLVFLMNSAWLVRLCSILATVHSASSEEE